MGFVPFSFLIFSGNPVSCELNTRKEKTKPCLSSLLLEQYKPKGSTGKCRGMAVLQSVASPLPKYFCLGQRFSAKTAHLHWRIQYEFLLLILLKKEKKEK